MHEFRMDLTSHLSTAEAGWSFVATGGLAGLAAVMHAQAWINAHRAEKAALLKLPFPWDEPQSAEAPLSEAEVQKYRADLLKRSAFREK